MLPEKKGADNAKMPPPPSRNITTRNITDTQGWKSSSKGVKRFWKNYMTILQKSFNGMNRSEQEDLINNFSMVMTMGVTAIIAHTLYAQIPLILRVIGLPVAFFAAWWVGRRVVGAVVTERMSRWLKEDERDEFSIGQDEFNRDEDR